MQVSEAIYLIPVKLHCKADLVPKDSPLYIEYPNTHNLLFYSQNPTENWQKILTLGLHMSEVQKISLQVSGGIVEGGYGGTIAILITTAC